MGKEAYAALAADDRFEIAAVLVRNPALAEPFPVPAFADAKTLLEEVEIDVWLDLTDATSVVSHADLALAANVRPVLGATGYLPEDIDRWRAQCDELGIGGIAAPNFAIGALLMTRFAAEAARFYPHAEIIELHHDGKRDAPSGTAKRTAEAMAQARAQSGVHDLAATVVSSQGQKVDEGSKAASTSARSVSFGYAAGDTPVMGTAAADAKAADAASQARGLRVGEVPVHSIRLPGLVAHQEVLFGGTGEVLTIRHDSLSRSSFMPGILYCCAKVMELRQFVYGLEHLLW
nr:dihydrodipicolinate reductase C-terminal domain-containing protein [Alicyclobacillus cycloheptanicus]